MQRGGPEALRAGRPGYAGPVQPSRTAPRQAQGGYVRSSNVTNGETMGDLVIVLTLIVVAAVASGVLVPLLVGAAPRTEEEREERDARLREELAIWS